MGQERIQLGIDTTPRGPRRPARGPAPMNSVGLFSLLCSLASYPVSLWALHPVVILLALDPPPTQGFIDATLLLGLPPALIALSFSSLAMLVCRLGRQSIVYPFALVGLLIPVPPVLAGCSAIWRIYRAVQS